MENSIETDVILNFTYSQKEVSLNQHVITLNRPLSNIFFFLYF